MQAEVAIRKVYIAQAEKNYYEERQENILLSMSVNQDEAYYAIDDFEKANAYWQSVVKIEAIAKKEALQAKNDRFIPYDMDVMRAVAKSIANMVSSAATVRTTKDTQKSKRATAIEKIDQARAKKSFKTAQANDEFDCEPLATSIRKIEYLNIPSEAAEAALIFDLFENHKAAAKIAVLNGANEVGSNFHISVNNVDESRSIRDAKIKIDAQLFEMSPLAVAVRALDADLHEKAFSKDA